MAMNTASTMRPAGWSGELQDLQVSDTIPPPTKILSCCTCLLVRMIQYHTYAENNMYGRPVLDARRQQYVRTLSLCS